ncbi:MAG: hypothetical protein IH840_01180 [Candidatus Heimdallarchaeota archaeon]|nr:hypothetical protein [Candidatus Heimdallarchaeota archaeon]
MDKIILKSTDTASCTLPEPDLKIRMGEIRSTLFQNILRKEELTDGFKIHFEFNKENFQNLTDFILFESVCCSFMNFEVRIEPKEKSLVFKLEVNENQRELLKSYVANL